MKKEIKLVDKVTAIEYLPRLTKFLNGPKIYIKRDDETGRGGGGNKLRKYERLINDALSNKCDCLIIAGHFQSNASRALVACACQLGLKSFVVCKELIPSQNEFFLQNGNALLMNLMDANIVKIDINDDYTEAMNNLAQDIKNKGGKPYIIPFGGSNMLGALGYVDCSNEIIMQCHNMNISLPDYIYTASGSGGTQAGLIAGFDNHNSKIVGISVLHKKETINSIVNNLFNQLTTKKELSKNDLLIYDNYIGEGYGIITEEAKEAIKLLAKLEAIYLCPVYTAKAMAGLIDHIKSQKISKDKSVLFLHTGGFPLLFAYYNKLYNT